MYVGSGRSIIIMYKTTDICIWICWLFVLLAGEMVRWWKWW